MPVQVVSGATLACTFGVAPSTLTVLPTNCVACSGMPAATIMDFAPMVNIAPFGMCMSPANPQVAAATAAALGVLTPQPCIPATTSPWVAGRAHGGIRRAAGTRQCLHMHVHVGRRDQHRSPGQVQTEVP